VEKKSMLEKILVCLFSITTFNSCQLLPLNLSQTPTAKEEMLKKILAEAKENQEASHFYEDGTHPMGGIQYNRYFLLEEELISIGLSRYQEHLHYHSF
jgi:hypothetical protein